MGNGLALGNVFSGSGEWLAGLNRNALLGLAVSLACLAYVLRGVDWAQLWRQTKEVPLAYVLAVNALYALSFLARSLRWRVLLQPVARVRIPVLFSANLIGYMANNLLPARLGEPVRAWAGSRLAKVPLAASFSSLVAEKAVDGPVILLFFFAIVWLLEPNDIAGAFSPPYLRALGWSLLWLYLLMLALLVFFIKKPRLVIELVQRFPARWAPRAAAFLAGISRQMLDGLASLGNPATLGLLLVLSLAVRAPIFAMHLVFLPAVGLPLDPFMGAMSTVGGALASAVPGGPGYVGAYQLAVYWCLLMAGAPEKPALAYAVIYWAVQYFPLVGAGLCELYRQGLKLSALGAGLATRKPPQGDETT